jgi:hypothetical protein
MECKKRLRATKTNRGVTWENRMMEGRRHHKPSSFLLLQPLSDLP